MKKLTARQIRLLGSEQCRANVERVLKLSTLCLF